MALPPKVEVAGDARGAAQYWLARAAQHAQDSYAGEPLSKFPEDLRVYEHLLWESAANVVIELGTWCSASALWFRDRLRSNESYGRIERPLVITVDVELAAAPPHVEAVDPDREGIVMLEASVTELPGRVAQLRRRELPGRGGFGARLRDDACPAGRLSPLRGPEGFFVVEDGCVDVEELRLSPDWPRGVLPAVHDFLAAPAGEGGAP
jgi:hypothetical protein